MSRAPSSSSSFDPFFQKLPPPHRVCEACSGVHRGHPPMLSFLGPAGLADLASLWAAPGWLQVPSRWLELPRSPCRSPALPGFPESHAPVSELSVWSACCTHPGSGAGGRLCSAGGLAAQNQLSLGEEQRLVRKHTERQRLETQLLCQVEPPWAGSAETRRWPSCLLSVGGLDTHLRGHACLSSSLFGEGGRRPDAHYRPPLLPVSLRGRVTTWPLCEAPPLRSKRGAAELHQPRAPRRAGQGRRTKTVGVGVQHRSRFPSSSPPCAPCPAF